MGTFRNITFFATRPWSYHCGSTRENRVDGKWSQLEVPPEYICKKWVSGAKEGFELLNFCCSNSSTSDNGGKYWVTGNPRIYFGLVEEIPVPLATRVGDPIFYFLKRTFSLGNQSRRHFEEKSYVLPFGLDEVKRSFSVDKFVMNCHTVRKRRDVKWTYRVSQKSVIGCVISPLRQQAESRNLGQKCLANSVHTLLDQFPL